MIYNNIFNYGCFPLIAATPFTGRSTTPRIVRGEVGLSGPNVDLIAFNSGDFDFTFTPAMQAFFVTVGLGVAVDTSEENGSQLGIVFGHRCILTNFEIAYSGSRSTPSVPGSFIEYTLRIFRSTSNDGFDYPITSPTLSFSGRFLPPFGTGQISRNILITVPTAVGNDVIFPGDRLVLFVFVSQIPFDSLVVGASVECTPL